MIWYDNILHIVYTEPILRLMQISIGSAHILLVVVSVSVLTLTNVYYDVCFRAIDRDERVTIFWGDGATQEDLFIAKHLFFLPKPKYGNA